MKDSDTRKTETERIEETFKPVEFREPETLENERNQLNPENLSILKPGKLKPEELKKP